MTKQAAALTKWSACLVLAIYVISTPSLLALLLLLLSIYLSHRALRLLKARSTSSTTPAVNPLLSPEDRAWIKHQTERFKI